MINTGSHIREQIAFRRAIIKLLKEAYHPSYHELRKHQTMLDYYLKQIKLIEPINELT